MTGVLAEAMDKIVEMSEPIEFKVGDRIYSSKPIHPVKDPVPAPIEVSTLTGLKDYFARNPDALERSELIFHVAAHDRVEVYGPLFGDFEQRKVFVSACFNGTPFPFGTFIDPEMFNIYLQAMFVQDATTAKILSVVGNISDERVNNIGDDGVTQQVTAKIGIARRENVAVPNPVNLTPYRTFLDAKQPSSNFVFRMRSGKGEKMPSCALFEADGGRWKLEAAQNVKTWIVDNIGPDNVLA